MYVLMRPTLLLRCLGGIKKLEFSKVSHARFKVCDRDNVLDLIDLYPKVGPLGFALHNDYVVEVELLFKSITSYRDESHLSKEYLSVMSRMYSLHGYPLLGRQCHGYLLKSGFLLHQYVKATLVRVYTMLSDVVGAMELLHCTPGLDTRRYNLILVGVVEKGFLNEALVILRRFMLAEDVVWNKDTYIGVFGLCARLKDLNLGRQAHNKLLKSSDVKSDDESVCNAVMKMYGKCKDILSARKAFDRCKDRNVVIWTTILAAYSEHGSFEDSLDLFSDMQREDVVPNEFTFSVLLAVSAELFSMAHGSVLHALAVKTGFEGLKKVNNALINMYSRTGDIKAAEKVFLGTTYNNRDIVTWNMMICGYSLHGSGNESLALFQEMLKLGELDPNYETFVGVLRACGHLGLVEEGFYYLYELMKQKGVKPGIEHYMCTINMLIKAGQLNEALSFILSTPSKWDVFAWTTLLSGCHAHEDYNLGIQAAKLIPDDVATKVSKRCGVAQVHEVMEIRDIEKECGGSWMEVGDKRCIFTSVCKGDPKFVSIHRYMKAFRGFLNFLTNKHDEDIEDVLKEDRDAYHSEEIAVAYAILETHNTARICIIKASGEICGDCHTLIKLATKIFKNRLITVRDAFQFHNFLDGHCSCGDYW